jgi:dUTP pyrophosphatase
MEIKINKLSENAIIPTNQTGLEAGYDLYSTEDAWLRPHERKLFKTNIAMEIPDGYYGRVAPRSGLAFKHGIDVLAGVIDQTYRGDIGVILYNTNGGDDTNSVQINKGQAIAQIIIENCAKVKFIEVADLNDTARGDKGYGSSDKKQ